MRLLHALSYIWFLIVEVNKGCYQVAARALLPRRAQEPMIIEFQTHCHTDLEIAALASSITITPGTLVLGVAAATGDADPTMFVHIMFSDTREEALAGLRDMEARLLRVTRGRGQQ